MPTALHEFLVEEDGVDAIEYGLIAALIFLVIVGSVSAAATQTVDLFDTISNSMSTSP